MRSSEFDAAAFEDLAWWVQHDRKRALRIVELIRRRSHRDVAMVAVGFSPRTRCCAILAGASTAGAPNSR